jgi:hypothetical protein
LNNAPAQGIPEASPTRNTSVVGISVPIARLSDHAVGKVNAEHDTALRFLCQDPRRPTHAAPEIDDVIVYIDVHEIDQLPRSCPVSLFPGRAPGPGPPTG